MDVMSILEETINLYAMFPSYLPSSNTCFSFLIITDFVCFFLFHFEDYNYVDKHLHLHFKHLFTEIFDC